MAGGFERLACLSGSLLNLELPGCRIRQLPSVLSALTALTSLALYTNLLLAGGWQHLTLLRSLRHVDCRNCGLAAPPPALAVLQGVSVLV